MQYREHMGDNAKEKTWNEFAGRIIDKGITDFWWSIFILVTQMSCYDITYLHDYVMYIGHESIKTVLLFIHNLG